MKYFFIYSLIFMASCHSNTELKELEGIYITHYENEFGVYDDTLVLKKANEKNLFTIVQTIGATKRLDSKVFPREWRTENWILEYNSEKQTFFELHEGKTLVLNKQHSTLQSGTVLYKRIK